MKKYLLTVLFLIICIALFACGIDNENIDKEALLNKNNNAEQEEASTNAETYTGTIDWPKDMLPEYFLKLTPKVDEIITEDESFIIKIKNLDYKLFNDYNKELEKYYNNSKYSYLYRSINFYTIKENDKTFNYWLIYEFEDEYNCYIIKADTARFIDRYPKNLSTPILAIEKVEDQFGNSHNDEKLKIEKEGDFIVVRADLQNNNSLNKTAETAKENGGKQLRVLFNIEMSKSSFRSDDSNKKPDKDYIISEFFELGEAIEIKIPYETIEKLEIQNYNINIYYEIMYESPSIPTGVPLLVSMAFSRNMSLAY